MSHDEGTIEDQCLPCKIFNLNRKVRELEAEVAKQAETREYWENRARIAEKALADLTTEKG